MIALACFLALVSPPDDDLRTQGLAASQRGDYKQAATTFEELERRHHDDLQTRAGWTFAAAVAWQRHAEVEPEALCHALKLVGNLLLDLDGEPDLVESFAEQYRNLVIQRREMGAECRREVAKPKPSKTPAGKPTVNPASVRLKPTPIPKTDSPEPRPAPKQRNLAIAGGVLTSVGIIGAIALTGQAVVYTQTLNKFIVDQDLRTKVKTQEQAMVATGVAAGSALITGVTLLAVRQRLQIQPSLGGLTLRGQF